MFWRPASGEAKLPDKFPQKNGQHFPVPKIWLKCQSYNTSRYANQGFSPPTPKVRDLSYLSRKNKNGEHCCPFFCGSFSGTLTLQILGSKARGYSAGVFHYFRFSKFWVRNRGKCCPFFCRTFPPLQNSEVAEKSCRKTDSISPCFLPRIWRI